MVTVLLDGDSPNYIVSLGIFQFSVKLLINTLFQFKDYMSLGSGKKCAESLIEHVRSYAQARGIKVESNRIQVKVFFNEIGAIKGKGIDFMGSGEELGICLKEFSQYHPLFVVKDAGRGKETAETQLKGKPYSAGLSLWI